MNELENLSIVIVTWKGDELLRNCLDSLAAACGTASEIVVVDNAKLSSTQEIVKQFPNAVYIATEKNLGFAGGNNVGLSHCHREFVVLLNNDTIIHEEPFTKLIAYLREHEKVGIVQGTMALSLQGGGPDACGLLVTHMGAAIERRYRTMKNSNVSVSSAVYAAKGALMFFRRTLPEKIGGLFHDFYFNNYEDVDFSGRAWLAGYEVHYVPTPAIEHLCGQSIVRLNRTAMHEQAMYNALVSWLTILSPLHAVRLVSGWMIWNFTLSVCVWLRQGNLCLVKMFFVVCTRVLKTRRFIRKIRREIQSRRAVPDCEIFRRTMVRLPLRYYWDQLRGRSWLMD